MFRKLNIFKAVFKTFKFSALLPTKLSWCMLGAKDRRSLSRKIAFVEQTHEPIYVDKYDSYQTSSITFLSKEVRGQF